MSLQNQNSLFKRINKIKEEGIITEEVAKKLKKHSLLYEQNRSEKIWFCFFKPYLVPERGISHFFKYWGGEALYKPYMYNQNNQIILDKLKRIGTPCIIKAKVPMNKLDDRSLPDEKMFMSFLKYKGHKISNSIDHEAYCTEIIPSDNILDIFQYPSKKFIELSKCNKWDESTLSDYA